MDIRTKCQARVTLHRLEISAGYEAIKRAERIARKENRPVPQSEMQALSAVIRDAKANEASACAALEGVCKYPPVKS